ncbi:MAG: hypothetical protein QNJ16_20005 [Rhodobacter sp.]|nr:hypothetical protein [Rhodobacter sp.]
MYVPKKYRDNVTIALEDFLDAVENGDIDVPFSRYKGVKNYLGTDYAKGTAAPTDDEEGEEVLE